MFAHLLDKWKVVAAGELVLALLLLVIGCFVHEKELLLSTSFVCFIVSCITLLAGYQLHVHRRSVQTDQSPFAIKVEYITAPLQQTVCLPVSASRTGFVFPHTLAPAAAIDGQSPKNYGATLFH
uniref:MARVEL domain-containing protein n=1 Tax=Trichuris muris TaxID=70415 RepID=A0A5S6R3F4_TRIMR